MAKKIVGAAKRGESLELTPATNGAWQDDEVVSVAEEIPEAKSAVEADQAPEPALDSFTQYINGELHWFREASFGKQRGYHTAATVQSRGFLLLAELLIALEHRLGQIDHALQKANDG